MNIIASVSTNRVRLGARAVLAAGLAVLATPALASDAVPAPDPDAPWMQRSGVIVERAMEQGREQWTVPQGTEAQRKWAQRIADLTDMKLRGEGRGVKAAREMFPEAGQLPLAPSDTDAGRGESSAGSSSPDTVRVFLTLGEGEEGRRRFAAQLRALAGMENVEVLLRGLPADMRRIGELIGLLAEIANTIEDAPPVLLAPERFREAGIEAAPTVVLYRDGEPLARITGSLGIAYLTTRVERGQRGKLGARGQVRSIAERDLMSVIRERWARIDWQAMKDQALADYWQAYQPTALPEAREPRETRVDPSIVVARTIRAPDGRVIARKGQHINPLALVPFTGAVIAFDGGVPEQVRLAGLLAERARTKGLRPILLTQGLPGETPGFEALERLERRLGERVYLLDARIIARFDIQALPARVRSDDAVFVTREFVPNKALARLAGTAPAVGAQTREREP